MDGLQLQRIEFEPVVARCGDVRVTIRWTGEGYSGAMSDDPEDEDRPVLRFFAEERQGASWVLLADRSTYLLATDPRRHVEAGAELLASEIANATARARPLFDRLAYLHLGTRGPAIDVPIDSKCRSF